MREVMKIFRSSPSYWAAHEHLPCKQFFFECINGFESLTPKVGMQTVTILECMLSPKACLYTGIRKALVHSRGEEICIRAVEVSCRMLLYLLRDDGHLYEVMQHSQSHSKCADCSFCCWWGS